MKGSVAIFDIACSCSWMEIITVSPAGLTQAEACLKPVMHIKNTDEKG